MRKIVYINGAESYEIKVTSGVPQGSTLGTLLFLIYINDAIKSLKVAKALMFIDDTKLLYRITCMEDVLEMQNYLSNYCNWCEELGLNMNIMKCTRTAFGTGNNVIKCDYSIGSHKLEAVDSYKDLGVIFDSKLNFKLHYEIVCQKAAQKLRFVLRLAKKFNNPQTLRTIYFNYVRSKMVYAVQV